jgi:hypothetical protein
VLSEPIWHMHQMLASAFMSIDKTDEEHFIVEYFFTRFNFLL